MTSAIWLTIGGCAVVTALIKAFGPVVLGGRELPPAFAGVVVLTAPALLAALVVTNTFTDGPHWHVDARAGGLAAAAFVIWRRGSVLTIVTVAAAVTALLRAAT